jgi:hypothetical protein
MSTHNGSGAGDRNEGEDDLGAGEAIDLRPAWRQRIRRPWVPLGLLVLLFILIAVVPRHSLRSRTLPPGHWGATLRCLERNTSFRVVAFGTGVAPEQGTSTVAVQTNIAHHTLAVLRQAPSSAAARLVVHTNGFGELNRSGYQTHGRIVWAYDQSPGASSFTVNAGERALIDACVRHPHG